MFTLCLTGHELSENPYILPGLISLMKENSNEQLLPHLKNKNESQIFVFLKEVVKYQDFIFLLQENESAEILAYVCLKELEMVPKEINDSIDYDNSICALPIPYEGEYMINIHFGKKEEQIENLTNLLNYIFSLNNFWKNMNSFCEEPQTNIELLDNLGFVVNNDFKQEDETKKFLLREKNKDLNLVLDESLIDNKFKSIHFSKLNNFNWKQLN